METQRFHCQRHSHALSWLFHWLKRIPSAFGGDPKEIHGEDFPGKTRLLAQGLVAKKSIATIMQVTSLIINPSTILGR
jgi:hypothetical protein